MLRRCSTYHPFLTRQCQFLTKKTTTMTTKSYNVPFPQRQCFQVRKCSRSISVHVPGYESNEPHSNYSDSNNSNDGIIQFTNTNHVDRAAAATVIDQHIQAGDRISARKAMQRWMHTLIQDLVQVSKTNTNNSSRTNDNSPAVSNDAIQLQIQQCLDGLRYMILLMERPGVVRRYDQEKGCIMNNDDAVLTLSDIPMSTMLHGLLATNRNSITLEVVETSHKLMSFLLNSLPVQSTTIDATTGELITAKKMYDTGLSMVPSYWSILHTTDAYVHILEEISSREERLERVSTLNEISRCWNGLDIALNNFLQSHHYYSEILHDIGKAYEFRGRRSHIRNQFQIITNNILKAMYRTMIDANRLLAFDLAHKWMDNFQTFAKLYDVEGPNIVTFTPIVCICGRAYELDKAQAWFEEMISQNIVPDTSIYNVLMDAYANCLHNQYNHVQGANPRPNIDIEDAISKIEILFDSLQNSECCQPDADSYKIYIKALSRVNDSSYAHRAENLAHGQLINSILIKKNHNIHWQMSYSLKQRCCIIKKSVL